MRAERYKQIACISEKDARTFETKANALLAGITEPEIILDRTKPYTAYIIYNVRKDAPESIIELLEMLDKDGGRATCANCPHFVRSTDRRKRWHYCNHKDTRVHEGARACEVYYLERMTNPAEAIEQFKNIPYEIE